MKRQSGFSLVELTIVTVVIGLLMAMILPASTAFMDLQRRREASTKLANVDTALLAFVITNKRLPCPANGTVASGTLGAGTEVRDATGDCTAQTSGVVPWASIGLSEADVTDGWGARFTYRVPDTASGFTRDTSLDISACDPGGTVSAATSGYICLSGCDHTTANLGGCTSSASMYQNRGLRVFDQAGTAINNPTLSTGAAYVVVVHMAEGGGGYSEQGALLIGNIAAGTNGEVWNVNGQAIRTGANGYFHSSQIVGIDGAAHFDDFLSHPSMAMIVTKAGLTPRH